MDISNIKIKKEKLKQIASRSVLFSASADALNDFIKAVDVIEENEQTEGYLDDMIKKFEEEREEVTKTYKNLLQE